MEYKNSYIFLKRNKEPKKITKEDNTIVINIPPSFMSLLKDSFNNIKFDYKNSDSINSGSIVIKVNNKEETIFFKYHSVWGNYYLDIIINSSNRKTVINILNDINTILIAKNNVFDKHYISIISYDYISEYYCNKLFPFLNEFERKLRKVLFNVYTLNFNLKYYSASPSKELQDNIEKKSKQLNKELNKLNNDNVSNNDCLTKYGFYSLDYSDIDKLLFTKYVSTKDNDEIQKFLNNNKDLSKLDDKELRKKFELLKPQNDWERFFGNKKIDDNFQQILDDIRGFRNNIAHCKFISKDQYNKCLKLLKQNIKSIDVAISVTEEKDFFNKNLELQQESFDRMSKMISEIVTKSYKPLMDNIELITQPMRELSEKMSSMVNPLSSIVSNIPSIVLPEIELPKFNIPNYFNDIETKDDDKNKYNK